MLDITSMSVPEKVFTDLSDSSISPFHWVHTKHNTNLQINVFFFVWSQNALYLYVWLCTDIYQYLPIFFSWNKQYLVFTV